MIRYEMLSKPGELCCNEDFVGASVRGEAACFLLSDGIGGTGSGQEASRLVSEYIIEDFRLHGEVSVRYLRKRFEESQKRLMDEQASRGKVCQMKATLVVLLLDAHTALWGHIGNSRLYYYRNKALRRRTFDHSVSQMLASVGAIAAEEIRRHVDRNRLVRVMGTDWELPRYQVGEPIERMENIAFLLCSRGLWEWVDEAAMKRAVKKARSPRDWLEKLEREAVKNGLGQGLDNYSAIAVFC